MRTWTILLLASAWGLLPACGAVAVDNTDASCGPNTCGACASGTVNKDTCTNGKWSCSCVAPPQTNSMCTATPVCSKSEVQYPDAAACAGNSPRCREQPACGGSIWCGIVGMATCNGAPVCKSGDTKLTSQADCPPGGGCYPVEACGETIWCAGGGGTPPAVWPPDATSLIAVDEGGGFVPNAPPGSPCVIGAARYTYTRGLRNLVWEVCDSNSTPYALKKSSRVLTVSEASEVDAVLANVTIHTNANSCGADKPVMWMSVTRPSGVKKYWDGFYACNNQGTYVDNLDDVFSTLGSFVK